jgi:lambda repressor-like predicted transcriptional regulator
MMSSSRDLTLRETSMVIRLAVYTLSAVIKRPCRKLKRQMIHL